MSRPGSKNYLGMARKQDPFTTDEVDIGKRQCNNAR